MGRCLRRCRRRSGQLFGRGWGGGAERIRERKKAARVSPPFGGLYRLSEVELGSEDDAAGIETGGVLAEGAGDLTVLGIETGSGVYTLEVGVVEEDVLDDGDMVVGNAGSADDVLGGVTDSEFGGGTAFGSNWIGGDGAFG